MDESNKKQIMIWSFVIGFIFLVCITAIFAFCAGKMFRVPSSYANLLNKLQGQVGYRLIWMSKRNEDGIEVYNMEFENNINVDFYICQSKKDAKLKYEKLLANSVGSTFSFMGNSRKIFERDNKYNQVFKYHNKNDEDFVVNICAMDKENMEQFMAFYYFFVRQIGK